MTDTAPITRVRNRAAGMPQPTQSMKDKALNYHVNNTAMNAHKRAADAVRKALYTEMTAAGVVNFPYTATVEGAEVTLDIAIETPTGTEIDVAALYKFMKCADDPKQLKAFLAIVSATQKSVVDALGTAAATRCSLPTKGKENVNVKPRKATV